MRRPSRIALLAVALAASSTLAAETDPVFPPGWRQGFARKITGRDLSYRWSYPDHAVALLCRAVDASWAIEWEAEPPPDVAPDAPVSYVFHAGLNSSGESHRFTLLLDGAALLSFDTGGGTAHREWTATGADGARLSMKTTRIGSFDERFGFMTLTVPRRRLGSGPPRLRVEPEAAGHQDYVLVYQEPVRAFARVAAEEAILAGGRRRLTADVSHLGPDAPVVVEVAGREVHHGTAALGHTAVVVGVPDGASSPVGVAIRVGGETVLREDVALAPVARRTFHLVPHSHVDIGYSDPQPEVERKQWKNLKDALALAAATREEPPEARFRWQAEGLWAVETYLAQAPEAERRAFADAVARGEIELPMNLTNVLTGLCHPEELARWTDPARRLKSRYGLEATPVAMHTDIPGLAWPTVTALAQAGVRWFSSGPNYMPTLRPDRGDRIGATLNETGDKPFWWVSPSGRERLLYWTAGRGYSWFHGGNVGRIGETAERSILDYARELARDAHPYEMVQVRYTVGGDNGPVDPELPKLVADWNARYETPRLAISTERDVFEALEKAHGKSLPERRGDMTPYWEDGAISSAGEEALARASARRLLQAEAIWALDDPAGFPAAKAAEAWRQLLMWHEHTWGAAASVSDPDRPDVVAQWEYKRAFALRADEGSRALLDAALARRAPQAGVDVIETLARPRAALVELPAALSKAGDRVIGPGGPLASQRLRDGSLAAWLPRTTPLGATRLRVETGRAAAPASPVRAEGAVLENEALRVELDPATGAVRRFLDKARGRDLAGPQGLARYRYVAGRNPELATDARNARVTVEDAGPLVATLRVEADADGARSLVTTYRLAAGADRLDIDMTVDKKKVRSKEAAHVTFDLSAPGGRLRVDQGWNLMDPARDALPGSCREFVGAHDAVDASGPEGGISLGLVDSPLVELGTLVDERPNEAGVRRWREAVETGTTVHAYLLDNYWHTNYKADQEGPLRFRFVLRPHGPESDGATSGFSREVEQPPLVVAAGARPATARPLALRLGLDVHLVSLRPDESGKARLVRLLNAGEGPGEARVGKTAVRLEARETRLVRVE
ncbi:MAG: glycoside hydrolase family 38 C-terminal domain-containing protein [Vicinamibacteria bacterium]